MVPINLNKIIEIPPGVEKTEKYYWHHFGHSHHRRAYSKSGFVQRLKDNYFAVNQYGINTFGEDTFKKIAYMQDLFYM